MSGGVIFQAIVFFLLWLNHSFGSGAIDFINLLGMEAFLGLGYGVFNM